MVTNDPMVITNVVVCSAIVLRLMFFYKAGPGISGGHRGWPI
ncbi:hypothetical protein ERHA55_21410 [Erwinia rhapontici]|nr:hypothetical protein ERHA55_21410 [Erwinia rhapontici]